MMIQFSEVNVFSYFWKHCDPCAALICRSDHTGLSKQVKSDTHKIIVKIKILKELILNHPNTTPVGISPEQGLASLLQVCETHVRPSKMA